MSGLPFLRLIGGALFILAGLSAYYGFHAVLLLPLLLMIAGGVLILIVLSGYRPRSGDIAFFVIGLLVLGLATSGPGIAGPRETVTYSALRDQIDAERISVIADASFGSIGISFSDNESVAYRVEFSRPMLLPAFQSDESGFSFNNWISGDTLFLNASSFAAEIRIIIGPHYTTSVDASTATGSIRLTAPRAEAIESIRLSTVTGSITADISTEAIRELVLRATTGSVDLKSTHLAPATAHAPLTVSTSTGSIDFDVKIPRDTAATLTATVGFGSISHDLRGFTVTESTRDRVEATAGEPAKAERSFDIKINTGTGSIDLDAERLR